LAGFDVVVLVTVDAGALTPERIGWLDQYVRKGGGLWVVGGLFAFGRGHYTGSGLDELLPVSVVRFHDLGRSSPGAAITGVGAHPLVAGLDLSSRPVCPYVHELRPKPWATVVLTCGARPLLVVGRVGNGRVAAMAGTALGEAPPGRRAFWDWSGWSELVARLVRWLKGGA